MNVTYNLVETKIATSTNYFNCSKSSITKDMSSGDNLIQNGHSQLR